MSNTKTIKYAAHETLIKENEISRKMFILKSGKVQVFKHHMGNKITLATLGAGEIFGELSFFDAKPRSASVETLTPCEVVVVSGEKLDEELANIPKWVFGVFKSVFNRFRDMDNQLTQLQNITDFAQRAHGKNLGSLMIFMEIHRFNMALRLLSNDLPKEPPALIDATILEQTFKELIGDTKLSEKVYFLQLVEHNFVERSQKLGSLYYQLNLINLKLFDNYLKESIEQDRCFLLSYNTIAILRTIISQIDSNQSKEMKLSAIKMPTQNDLESAINELTKYALLKKADSDHLFFPEKVTQAFSYQSFLKSFDHSLNKEQ